MVLARDDRSIRPIQSNRPGAQAHEAHGCAVRRIRKSSGKIKLQVRAGSRARDVGTECLEPKLGLAERSTERARRNEQWLSSRRFRDPREILIFDCSAIAVHV